MTKKQKKAENNKHRTIIPFNTGERPHKSPKDYDRKNNKKDIDEAMKEMYND